MFHGLAVDKCMYCFPVISGTNLKYKSKKDKINYGEDTGLEDKCKHLTMARQVSYHDWGFLYLIL